MKIMSRVAWLSEDEVARALAGLPEATGYEVVVKPLRYRVEPSLSAITVFDDRVITLRMPEPFLPFGELVPFGAKRMPGERMRFVAMSEGISLRSPYDALRFLYCHEWYHWFLYEVRGKGWNSETACDRFALRNYRRRTVTMDDAFAALRRTPAAPARARRARPPRRSVEQIALPGLEADAS